MLGADVSGTGACRIIGEFYAHFLGAGTPIYKPNIGNLTDTGNFDPQFTAELPVDSVVDSSALAGQGNTFEGFTYNPNDDSALKQ